MPLTKTAMDWDIIQFEINLLWHVASLAIPKNNSPHRQCSKPSSHAWLRKGFAWVITYNHTSYVHIYICTYIYMYHRMTVFPPSSSNSRDIVLAVTDEALFRHLQKSARQPYEAVLIIKALRCPSPRIKERFGRIYGLTSSINKYIWLYIY